MCDRACLLGGGRLEADGEPAKVAARYREALGIAGG
jgi:ABC-type polysaccharide/polyol phosphate transport system ATPase subunit